MVKGEVILKDFKKITNDFPNYTLSIEYSSMDYLELINAFQFAIPLYFFIFVIFCLLIVFAFLIFWFINRMISRVENPPPLRIIETYKLVFTPQIVVKFFFNNYMIFIYLIRKL